jgi:hypothetical protein
MAAEETLIIEILVDTTKTVDSFAKLEKQLRDLRAALSIIPKQAGKEFDNLASNISKKLGLSIEQTRKKLIDFRNTAEKELKQGGKSLEGYKKAFDGIGDSAGKVIAQNDRLSQSFKGLSNTIKSTFATVNREAGYKELAQQQREAVASTKSLETAVRKQQEAFAEQGSLKQLKQQLSLLKREFEELSAAERNSDFGRSLAANIKQTDGEIKKINGTLRNTEQASIRLKGSLRSVLKEGLQGLFSGVSTLGIAAIPSIALAATASIGKLMKGVTVLTEAFSGNARASRLVADETKSITSEYVKERSQVDALFAVAKNENASKKERAEAIKTINTLYKDYLPEQLTEKDNLDKINVAQKAVNKSVLEGVFARKKAEIVEKAFNEAVEANLEKKGFDRFKEQNDGLISAISSIPIAGQISLAAATNISDAKAKSSVKAISEIDVVLNDLKNIYEELNKEIDASGKGLEDAVSPEGVKKTIKETNDAIKSETKSIFELLSERKSKLEAEIKNRILQNKEYGKEQAELEKITKRLTDAEKEFAKAVNFAQTELQRLQSRQSELNEEIQNAITEGKPYSEQLNELISVTGELARVNKEFESVQKQINDALNETAKGSAKDYENQINALREKQENLSIASEEYLQIEREINEIDGQRKIIVDALALSIEDGAARQRELNTELSDQEAQNTAFENAKKRLSEITDATEGGAERVKQIQTDLQAELRRIEDAKVQRRFADIQLEIDALQDAKNKELQAVGDNAELKLAIEQKYQNSVLELQLEGAALQAQILQKEVEENAAAQEQITSKTTEEAQKRAETQKMIQDQLLNGIGQGISTIFQIIGNLEKQAAEKEIEQLERLRDAQLQQAEQFGASEEKKEAIRAEFEKKKEAAQKKAAQKAKALALAQAAIDIALSIIKVFASVPTPAAPAVAAIVGAIGALQLAAIASQKFKAGGMFDYDAKNMGVLGFAKAAKGAYLRDGAYHSEGGMPILNPYTGQKVAEIERGETIVNRKSTSLFYDELSFINSYKGNGVKYPGAKQLTYSQMKENLASKASTRFEQGGIFAAGTYFNPQILKMQSGAVIASDIAAQANRQINSDAPVLIALNALTLEVRRLQSINKQGFESVPSTAQEIDKINNVKKAQDNAS